MSMIKAEHLTFSYPSSSDPIFEDVNFQIDTDWKLGFVGRNGRGLCRTVWIGSGGNVPPLFPPPVRQKLY